MERTWHARGDESIGSLPNSRGGKRETKKKRKRYRMNFAIPIPGGKGGPRRDLGGERGKEKKQRVPVSSAKRGRENLHCDDREGSLFCQREKKGRRSCRAGEETKETGSVAHNCARSWGEGASAVSVQAFIRWKEKKRGLYSHIEEGKKGGVRQQVPAA